MTWRPWLPRGPPRPGASRAALPTLRRPGPRSLERAAWDGNGGPPRPALLPFFSEVTSMDGGAFLLFVVCLMLICVIWSRDERRPQ
jgi:hypothetical protein